MLHRPLRSSGLSACRVVIKIHGNDQQWINSCCSVPTRRTTQSVKWDFLHLSATYPPPVCGDQRLRTAAKKKKHLPLYFLVLLTAVMF